MPTPAHTVAKAIDGLTEAVHAVAHGGPSSPAGLEALAVALGGYELAHPVGPTLDKIAGTLESIAAALSEGLTITVVIKQEEPK